jgi:hypothetical protein
LRTLNLLVLGVFAVFTFQSFAQGAAATTGSGGNVCKGGGTGKCQEMCKDMVNSLKEQCLQDVLKKFKDQLAAGQIKDTDGGKWCSNESSANGDSVAVALVAGVAIGESSCDKSVPGPSAGAGGEKPEGYCQLNSTSVQPYPCCKGVNQLQLSQDGPTEAKCGMGEVLQNVTKDQVWAEGETGKGGKGAAAFNQSCANSKKFLKDKAISSVADACQNGGDANYLGTGGGKGDTTQ